MTNPCEPPEPLEPQDYGNRLVDALMAGARQRPLPELDEQGTSVEDTLTELAATKSGDVPWQNGQLFGMVHDGGPSVREVAERAAQMFLHENALNPIVFPSLVTIGEQITRWTARLLHGPDGASGFVTSGGTESILCAVLAARQRARARGVESGTIVVPASAHSAFYKAAFLYELPIVLVPLDANWAADLDALAAVIDERTIFVAGSAPQYPQGTMDPIPEMAALAHSVGAHFHVDACMGGHVLPFAERLGRTVAPWDFRVEGVDSISADNHKLGYAPKGVSTIVYRTPALAAHQVWELDWPGGYYATPTLLGARPAAPMAAAWAVMKHLGLSGYDRLVDVVLTNADLMRAAVESIEGLRLLGNPTAHLFALAADDHAGDPVSIPALGAAMRSRGWVHEPQHHPDSLHVTLSNVNTAAAARYPDDLAASVAEVRASR
jgi:glutamate/tyrosine decarboxylase-like PLP-dependent enzyme